MSQKSNFIIYTASTFLQKGISFLLIPLYTIFLDPSAYGILSICTGMLSIFVVFFTLGLDAAVLRFYHDYKDQQETLSRKIGSLLVAIAVISISVSVILVLSRVFFDFRSFLGIPVFPYFLLIIIILLFQPTYNLVLALFQAMGDAKRYAIYSFGFFFVNICLTLIAVIKYKLGATGVLLSQLASFSIFYVIGLIMIRKYWRFAFEKKFVKSALKYSLPLIPHSLGGQLAATADRYILTYFFDVAKTGLLQIAYQLSQPMEILTTSYNRTFMPYFFRVMSEQEKANEIKKHAVMATLFFSTCALSITFISREIFVYFINTNYSAASSIINLLCFSHVATSLYYFYSAILFYNKNLTKKIPIITFSAAILSIGLNIILVKFLGLYGAAIAQLCSQILLFVIAILISHKYTRVAWAYKEMILIFLFYFVLSFIEPYLPVFDNKIQNILYKLGIVGFLFLTCLYYYHKWFGLNFKFLKKRDDDSNS